MNVYDFDKTIYNGDSTLDFYFFCIKKKPLILKKLPKQLYSAIKYKMKIITKTEFKENFYSFLQVLDNVDDLLEEFWNMNKSKIKDFYLKQKSKNDVIISASPNFLLDPICKQLGIKYLIASQVDKHTGKYTGINCYGEEKVRRFNELFPNLQIDNFYSDSLADTPIAKCAKQAFLVKNNELQKWN